MVSVEQLEKNYNDVLSRVRTAAVNCDRNPADIKVLAVSKTHNHTVIEQAIESHIPIFAESYAQEFRDKYQLLSDNYTKILSCEFHFIGHLQRNKVKYVAPFVSTIHTVDDLSLAEEIDKQCGRLKKKIDVLIQVNTSEEKSKSGVHPKECLPLAIRLLELSNIQLVGLMTIGTFSDNEIIIRKEFSLLRSCLDEINKTTGLGLKELSMGMSHDFEIAIQEQATMVRVGTSIFGERKYY